MKMEEVSVSRGQTEAAASSKREGKYHQQDLEGGVGLSITLPQSLKAVVYGAKIKLSASQVRLPLGHWLVPTVGKEG